MPCLKSEFSSGVSKPRGKGYSPQGEVLSVAAAHEAALCKEKREAKWEMSRVGESCEQRIPDFSTWDLGCYSPSSNSESYPAPFPALQAIYIFWNSVFSTLMCTSGLLSLGTVDILDWIAVQCRMFDSIPDFYPRSAGGTTARVVTNKNVKHFQTLPNVTGKGEGQNHSC